MTRSLFVLFLTAAPLISGCGSRLTPAEACETSIAHAEDCGTYVPGSFGGTGRASDLARCTSGVELLNDQCQQLFSDVAQCYARSCDSGEACRPTLDRFTTTCSP